MLCDPFASKALTAYLDASSRYADTLDEMHKLAATNEHLEFRIVAAELRRLAAEVEAAHFLILKDRLDAAARP